MKKHLISIIIFIGTTSFGQITSTLDKITNVAIRGYLYDKSDEFEKSLPKDTFFYQ